MWLIEELPDDWRRDVIRYRRGRVTILCATVTEESPPFPSWPNFSSGFSLIISSPSSTYLHSSAPHWEFQGVHLYVAFDIVDRSTLWNILHIFALNPKLLTLFTVLYDGADQRKMYRQVLDRCWCPPALCSLSRFIQVHHQPGQGFLLISPTPSLTTTVVTAEVVKALRKINFSYTKWRNN